MAYEQKDGYGGLFRNDKKDMPEHPDTRGDCKINGVDYWIAGWTKKTKDGDKWSSLKFTPKDGEKRAAPKARQVEDDPADDLPF